eukprot:3058273-Pyramimonas_sp.AAC.1
MLLLGIGNGNHMGLGEPLRRDSNGNSCMRIAKVRMITKMNNRIQCLYHKDQIHEYVAACLEGG